MNLNSTFHKNAEPPAPHFLSLPVASIAPEVNSLLLSHSTLVVTAPPGAGKSTLLPLTLLEALPEGSKLLLLEPRRLAACQVAERMASLLGERVGQRVGYRVRFDTRVSPATRIEVLTEGILTRMLVADATLGGVSAVLFDEFHERSIHSDVSLALTRQLQQLLRPDLKIILMSATIDAAEISQALSAPVVQCVGRLFPVEVLHSLPDADRFNVAQRVAEVVLQAYRTHEGDILAFLPGQGEILRCAQMLEPSLGHDVLRPLYGNLSAEAQRAAIAPSPKGRRKVVLATPVAETSLTIEGVRVVVDGGLFRTPVVDQRTGLTRLETMRISLDMATQRAGRAGRVAEGTCYRLWSVATGQRMASRRTPELLEADLAPMLLDIAAFGERNPLSLPWLTPPPAAHLARARELLQLLGALTAEGAITPMGIRMASLSCHPRMARMILSAATPSQQSLACDIAALLEEKDPLSDVEANSSLPLRVCLLREARRRHAGGRWSRQLMIAEEYARMTHSQADNQPCSPQEVGALVAHAYPERVAQAVDDVGTYRLASGDTVRLDARDSLTSYGLLSVASLFAAGSGVGRVLLAAPVSLEDLLPLTKSVDLVSWDAKSASLLMQRQQRVGRLVLTTTPLSNPPREAVLKALCEAVSRDGRSLLDWSDEVSQLQQRILQVALWHPDIGLPDVSTDAMLACTADWLPPFLVGAQGRLRTSLAELKKIRLTEAVWSLLTYSQQQEVDRLAPSHLLVPSGSRIRVDYRLAAGAPVLSVRLQECFGLQQTPRVDGGHCPVLMELLSPGFKPVQLTQDLASFWQSTYFEVRKELRRRYPKHHWPDDPLAAPPLRGPKKLPSR